MRSLPETPDAAVRDTVNRRLDAIEREDGVRVLFACESGSRAWGFTSPDSDYDVRFVYAHPHDWYLSIGDQRDVTERPIVDLYDVNGWDLRKALHTPELDRGPRIEAIGVDREGVRDVSFRRRRRLVRLVVRQGTRRRRPSS